MRTTIYVDGLNLYYRCLRNSQFKWLDLSLLFSNLLDTDKYEIKRINYYYANIKAMPYDPKSPERQSIYLRALKTLNCLSLIKGDFTKRNVEKRIVGQTHNRVKIIWAQEKGSDVNLATNLLNDAWKDQYDASFVVSSDPDLKEGMRLVKEQFPHKEINLITPGKRIKGSRDLKEIADHHLEIIQEDLKSAQFPDPIPGTNITKPKSW